LYFVWQFILFIYYVFLFLRIEPNVIHIQSKDDFIAATYAGIVLKKRIIWTDHADLKHIWRNVSVWYKNPIGKVIYRAAHHTSAITVVSRSEQSLVSANFPKKSQLHKKLVVIYNGVTDVSGDYPKNKAPVFTYLVASRLVKDKGISEVLDAFKDVHKKHKNTSLNIIGDGPDSAFFDKKANNLPGVQLLGYKSQPLTYMAIADVFVHPTYHEGFSVALVEAGMMSLPIIATRVGGNVEIIVNNKTGLLVPIKDSPALAKAMNSLYENNKLRESIAKNARIQYIQRFQFNKIVHDSFIPLYIGRL
jgi:glycosyltransferase involved in cell wall biosynthesis